MCQCGFSGGGAGANVPQWQNPITFTHADLQAAALTSSFLIYNLPAAGIIHGVKLKASILFSGPAITEYWVGVGFAGLLQGLMIEYDLKNTAIGDQDFAISQTFDSRDHAATTPIYIGGRSVGANLDTSNQGTAQLWLLTSVAL